MTAEQPAAVASADERREAVYRLVVDGWPSEDLVADVSGFDLAEVTTHTLALADAGRLVRTAVRLEGCERVFWRLTLPPLHEELCRWLTLAAEPVPVALLVQWAAGRGATPGETQTALATLVRAGRATSTGEAVRGAVRRWFAAVGAQ